MLLIFLLSYWQLTRADDQCQFSFKDYSFDFTDLKAKQDYTVDTKEYQYVLNFCGNANSHWDCKGSVCQYSKSSLKLLSTPAYWTGSPAPMWSWLDSSKPEAGLTLRYENGDSCFGGKKPRIVTVHMPCTPSANGRHIELETDNLFSCSGNGYVFKLPTCHSCLGGCNGTGMSQGSVLIILGLLIFMVYLSFGCWYNHRTYNTAYGLESFPHLEHWKTVPGLVYDGMQFSYHHSLGLYARFKQSRPASTIAPGSAGAKKETGENIEKQGLLSGNNDA